MEKEIVLSIFIFTTFVFLLIISRIQKKRSQAEVELSKANELIMELTKIKEKYQPIIDIENEVIRLNKEKNELDENYKKIKDYYSEYELKIDLEEMSYYQPKYDFGNYLEFSDALTVIREAQRTLIKNKNIFINPPNDSNKNIGNLAINALNGEVNTIINSITFNNFEKLKQKLEISFNKINTLLANFKLEISSEFFDLKVQEMALVYDIKEQERKIKEEQADLKEQMKEEEKARVEAEKAREKAIKEQEQYEKALEKARQEIESKTGAEKDKYENQIKALEEKLKEALEERERATAMAQITKKGHVYIISNIGSFGENIYKIGMTRRKEPIDRVKELGDASVPFPFDIHALIYTEDAPTLENALHKEFNDNRINKINLRKEFFNISINDIEKKCQDLGYKVKLSKLAEAIEFRQTKDLSLSSNTAS